jgi:hypothetical protein
MQQVYTACVTRIGGSKYTGDYNTDRTQNQSSIHGKEMEDKYKTTRHPDVFLTIIIIYEI